MHRRAARSARYERCLARVSHFRSWSSSRERPGGLVAVVVGAIHRLSVITFAESVAAVLQPRVPDLAQRWARGARARAASSQAEQILRAVVACLDRDARWQGEVMRLAWTTGAAAHAAGVPVHHVVRDADALLGVLLAAVEESARARALTAAADDEMTVADALDVARRFQRAVGLHAQAAVTSYVHAQVRTTRARWRVLRHDLRNPLGTIRSALSLMEDEALPPDTRTGPRIRAMVARNAGALEGLIATRLDDRAADALVAAPQDVSLRDVALAVRSTLDDAIRHAGCEIVVDDALPVARVDEAAVELTLGTLLLAAVSRARPGDVLRVESASPRASSSRTVMLR